MFKSSSWWADARLDIKASIWTSRYIKKDSFEELLSPHIPIQF